MILLSELLKVTLIGLFFGTFGTTIGGIIGIKFKNPSNKFLSFILSFASGLMTAILSFDLIPEALKISSIPNAVIGIILGIICMIICNVAVDKKFKIKNSKTDTKRELLRTGIITSIGLALHNFPEGLSTVMASYENITVGLSLAIAIAIHNIPEGIAIAAPIYASTKNRKKAITWASISGAVEIIGAVAGAMIVGWVIPAEFLNIMLGLVAGMMVFVAIDELLPAARRYQTSGHQVVYGVILGMAVVALSLTI